MSTSTYCLVSTVFQLYTYDFDGGNAESVCQRLNQSIQSLPPSQATGYVVNPSVEALIVILTEWTEVEDDMGGLTNEQVRYILF